MSKIIILGNSGTIGESLERHFQSKNGVEIYGYSSQETNLSDPKSTQTIAKLMDQDAILFFVSGITLEKYPDSLDNFAANVTMAVHVAKALASHTIRKLIYFSSVSVYGDLLTNLKINEDLEIQPTLYYGMAKYASECILKKAAEQSRSSFLCVRLCRVYGPGVGDSAYGPVRFIRSITDKEQVTLYGNGEELRAFLYIHDLVRIVNGLIEKDANGVINLAPDESHTFSEVIDLLKEIIPLKFRVDHTPRTRPLIHQRFDISKLRSYLPNFRFTPFRDGLMETYNGLMETHKSRGNAAHSSRN